MSKFFIRAGIGFVLGIAVCDIIAIFTCDPLPAAQSLIDSMGSLRAAMLLQSLLSGLYGAICMGTTILYEVERLPLALASLLHCMCVILPGIPLALLLGWCEGAVDLLIRVGIQLAVYFFIWLIMWLNYRREIKKMNELNTKE